MHIRNTLLYTLIALFPLQLCSMQPNDLQLVQTRWPSTTKSITHDMRTPNTSFDHHNTLKRPSENPLDFPFPNKKQRTKSPQGSKHNLFLQEQCYFFLKGIEQSDLTANIMPEDEQVTHVDTTATLEEDSQDDPVIIPEIIESPFYLEIKTTIDNFDLDLLEKLLITDEASQLNKDQKDDLHGYAKLQKKKIIQIRTLSNELASKTNSQEIKAKFSQNCNFECNNAQKISHYLYAFKFLPQFTFPQAFFTNAQRYRVPTQNPTPDQVLLALIKSEQEEISICCFSFDLIEIAKKLIRKKNKGVIVKIITDQKQARNNLTINHLINNGIPVLAPQNDVFEMNHHKFTLFKHNLFNKELLSHGSFNYTDSAIKRNWEDMSISDDPYFIAQFKQQFKDVETCSKPILLENIKK